jgi:lipopolysaccharide/colanic/teichoic acid biosynthesis glycosyltransferase
MRGHHPGGHASLVGCGNLGIDVDSFEAPGTRHRRADGLLEQFAVTTFDSPPPERHATLHRASPTAEEASAVSAGALPGGLGLEVGVASHWPAFESGHPYSSPLFHARLGRLLDVIAAGALLVLLLPVMLLAVLALLLDSPGPLFFRCDRVGWRGRPLRMLKLRKMHAAASAVDPPVTVDDDARFTRVGVWLARLKFDEFPQLWHVLRGEMSLVGPRPEDPRFVLRHSDEFARILDVRPGITGLSQIAFAEEARILDSERPVEDYVERILPQKIAMDRLYAANQTIWLDLRILYWTVVAILLRRPVAVNRTTAAMNIRRR